MACKLRKAIGAMKDQTSIGLAKVGSAANLEVNILKATSHDEIPMENRYVSEIVLLVSSNKVFASVCAQSIGKRIGKTRNWVVALKSLMLVLRIFQDGDPYFPREIFHAMKRGAKILNLSNFKDESTPNSWDYTSFIRTFALYLYERLDCFLTGKLQRRFTCYLEGIQKRNLKYSKMSNEPGIKGMKPTLVLDRITYWQRLLDRAIGSRPTGAAKHNSLIKISLYAIAQESFDLYRDISDGLSVILDNFFQLPYKACLLAFQACVKSSTQFDALSRFYAFCGNLGIGKTSEYPSIQKVSNEVMETLQEFLKDQPSFSADNGKPVSRLRDSTKHGLLPPLPKETCSVSRQEEANEKPGAPSKSSSSSLEELMIVTTDDDLNMQSMSLPVDQTSSCFDLVVLDDFQEKDQDQQKDATLSSNNGSTNCWDLVLAEITPTLKQVEQDQEQQKDATLSSNNGSKDCWDLVLAEIAFTPKQVEQHNGQEAKFQEQKKNTTSSSNNGSADNWDLVLAGISSTQPKQGDQEQKNSTSSSNKGSSIDWGLVLAEISSATKQVNQNVSQTRDHQEQQKTTLLSSNNGSKDCWDLVFAGIGGTKSNHTTSTTNKLSNGVGSSLLDLLFDQPSSIPQAQYNNPFLESTRSTVPSTNENYKPDFANFFDPPPTFQGTVPMVNAHQNPQTLNAITTTEPGLHIAGSYNKIGSALPTFHTQNVSMAMKIPSLAPQNANNKNMVSSSSSAFWAQDFDDGTKKSETSSTCCEKKSTETTMATINNNARDDDPFEAWIVAMTNNNKKNSSELKQEQSLL